MVDQVSRMKVPVGEGLFFPIQKGGKPEKETVHGLPVSGMDPFPEEALDIVGPEEIQLPDKPLHGKGCLKGQTVC